MSSNLTESQRILSQSYLRLNDEVYKTRNTNATAPRMMIFGTAGKGATSTFGIANANNVANLPRTIGREGDLLETAQEAMLKGEESLAYFRIGAKGVWLEHIGGTAGGALGDGLRIEAVERGKEMSTRLGIAYSTADQRLIIQDLLTKVVLFDNHPSTSIDLGAILVSGAAVTGSGSNIGSVSPLTAIPIASATTSDAQLRGYLGHDGTAGLSRMELYQECFRALKLAEGLPVSYYAAPEKATLDAPWSTSNTATGQTAFPNPNSAWDKLGKCYIEQDGENYLFYWDVDNDNAAEFWNVNDTGVYTGTSKKGKVFASGDFSLPNFAYLFASQMHYHTVEHSLVQACVGVEPPALGKSLSDWLGVPPVYSTDSDGNVTVTTDGTGLLGHKYLAGALGYRGAASYGGMILTNEPYFDNGNEQTDEQGNAIDIGKYLTIWAFEETFPATNGVRGSLPYRKISPAAYLGWRRGIPPGDSPTQKPYPQLGSRMLRLGTTYHELLKLSRITFVRNVPNIGSKVADSPTVSLIGSPYRRQGIMEITLVVNNQLRQVANNYVGRYVNGQVEAALQQDLSQAISFLKSAGLIIDGEAKLIITQEGRRLGYGNVAVAVVMPFELEQLFFSVSVTF